MRTLFCSYVCVSENVINGSGIKHKEKVGETLFIYLKGQKKASIRRVMT
jgi:hypothetical protein